MKKLIALIAALSLALVISGCTKGQEQADCEANGGHWEATFSHFLIVGKTLMPQYDYHCEMP